MGLKPVKIYTQQIQLSSEKIKQYLYPRLFEGIKLIFSSSGPHRNLNM
ncbi:hypothetical protein RBEAN4_0979 [Rickettsia bellii str. RML An4]|uniref:Uncharacterized protein n=1 Tax=Rickettsia bellii str. RML An4 TaxID=1359193 RepID=A0A0F3QBM1_RICBE|nr:hypothetical protein A1I_01960 [Rickettsia bellii OSU 85-389]KJV89985.1 hypothetical protein RBEAN4_0979 [Rickettsia bellii str. RML An4]